MISIALDSNIDTSQFTPPCEDDTANPQSPSPIPQTCSWKRTTKKSKKIKVSAYGEKVTLRCRSLDQWTLQLIGWWTWGQRWRRFNTVVVSNKVVHRLPFQALPWHVKSQWLLPHPCLKKVANCTTEPSHHDSVPDDSAASASMVIDACNTSPTVSEVDNPITTTPCCDDSATTAAATSIPSGDNAMDIDASINVATSPHHDLSAPPDVNILENLVMHVWKDTPKLGWNWLSSS